jgi:rhamnogalacturonyl hydrolase YesR
MFTFAFVSGVKNGWLDEATYALPARRAWLGVIRYLDEGANLKEVCIGTGEAATSGAGTAPDAQMAYYLARPRSTGDFHGQAPILWAASALLRPSSP